MALNERVPNGWRLGRLQDVAEVVGGSTPSRAKAEYWSGNVSWVAPSELTELPGRYLGCSRESISELGLRAAGLRILPPGSILLTSRATIGSTAINKVPVTTNQGFQSLIPNPDTNSLWLYYSVSAMRRELKRRSAGSTFLEISRDGVRTLPILIPPLHEQRAIAAILDSIDEAIERTEEVIAATERLRDALLHDLLTRGLPGRHTEYKQVRGLGTIPACWNVARLGDVAGINLHSWNPSEEDEAIQYLDLTAVSGPGLLDEPRQMVASAAPSRARRRARAGDILVSTVRPNLRGFARLRQAPSNLVVSTGFAVVTPNQNVADSFLYHHVMSSHFARFLHDATTGQAYPAVRSDDVGAYRLPFPPLEEQRSIREILDSIDQTIMRYDKNRDTLESFKTSTANALLSGSVRVGGEDSCE